MRRWHGLSFSQNPAAWYDSRLICQLFLSPESYTCPLLITCLFPLFVVFVYACRVELRFQSLTPIICSTPGNSPEISPVHQNPKRQRGIEVHSGRCLTDVSGWEFKARKHRKFVSKLSLKRLLKKHEWSSDYVPRGLINENRQLAFPRFQIRIHSLRDSPVTMAIARESHHQAE
jgi:hypothetical protein